MESTILIIIALFLAAAVLLILEVFTPSFGLLAAAALASLGAAIYMSFRISGPVGLIVLIASAFAVPLFVVFLIKYLPNSFIGKRVFLHDSPSATGEATPESPRLQEMVGKTGVAISPLRPSGAVRIEGHRVVAIAENGMIAEGTAVTVIAARGTDLIVRPESNS